MPPIECEAPQDLSASPGGNFSGQPASVSETNVQGEIGGGAGYSDIIGPGQADTTVPSGDGSALVSAINGASSGETIYVPEARYTVEDATLSADDVTVAGNRGASDLSGQTTQSIATDGGSGGTSPGATLVGQGDESRPITVEASNVRFTGLQFQGPNTSWEGEAESNEVHSVAIEHASGQGMQVDNCEGYGWSAVFVAVRGDGPDHVHHCSIHDNPGAAQGYGVHTGPAQGRTLIEKNYFNRNRHSVAADPDNPGYEVRYNVFGPVYFSHAVDQHGPDSAGGTLSIHHNTFQATEYSAKSVQDAKIEGVRIRGRPSNKAEVYNNLFHANEKPRVIRQSGEPKVDQASKYTASAANKAALENMSIRGNEFGSKQASGSVGAQSGGGRSPVSQDGFSF